MISKIHTATTVGLDVFHIEAEIDFTPALPAVVVVGLPDKAVQESKERIRSALKQSGYEFPLGKITVNLAPADLNKSGTGFDLPIAVGILQLIDTLKNKDFEKTIFIGELSLDGKLRSVNGILPICLWAKRNGFERIIIPTGNTAEASLVSGIDIYAIENLNQLVGFLGGEIKSEPIKPMNLKTQYEENISKELDENGLYPNDMAFVKGQMMAKRALEIAAAGGHNVLFIGSPGSGKTLLAKSYQTILPRMTKKEILEVTQVYSVSGLLKQDDLIIKRPFRSPHHSASHIALVGGGNKITPGEISLAHRGVLFLDEFPEFKRESIEVLRGPLEDGEVTISRANGTITYPSKFYLIAAANPTPSGYSEDDEDKFHIPQSQGAIRRYRSKFSGPILDRIDIQVQINQPKKDELQSDKLAEKSLVIAARVQAARDIQTRRFKGEKIATNAEMSLLKIKHFCRPDMAGKDLLNQAITKYRLSARAYHRVLKLSRTIADLNGHEQIKSSDIAESLQYRGKWG
jgi:magnesium chelatase family protein